jgi:hypothetical protein
MKQTRQTNSSETAEQSAVKQNDKHRGRMAFVSIRGSVCGVKAQFQFVSTRRGGFYNKLKERVPDIAGRRKDATDAAPVKRARFRFRFAFASSLSLLDIIRPRHLTSITVLMLTHACTVKGCLSYRLLVCHILFMLLMNHCFLVMLTDNRLEKAAVPSSLSV